MRDGVQESPSDAMSVATAGNGGKRLPVADMLDILRLISRVEPLEVLLDKVATTIVESFGIRAIVICVLDEKSGFFSPRAVQGFPVDQVLAIKKHVYTLERKMSELKDDSRIGRDVYYTRMEDRSISYDDEVDYIIEPRSVTAPRRSPQEWHELDFIDFTLTDRLGNLVGWIQVDEPSDRKVPSNDTIEKIRLLADLTAIAIENSRTYDEAIRAVGEAHGYLDLIVHDVGNMVSPLQYYLEQLRKSPALGERESHLSEKAHEVLCSIKTLVDNVRKLSEVRNSEQMPKSKFDLRDVMVKCISSVRRDFPSKDVVVNLDCPECASTVMADELIHDLFSNILSNAVKYNPNDLAEAEISILDGHSAWIVRIEDHGMGIPDDRKSKVFSRFAKRPDGIPGTGMGLSIASLLVDRYNGLITVKDRVPGDCTQGACFEVALPKYEPNEVPANGAISPVTADGQWPNWQP